MVTMKDIARSTGVSITTVSAVLRGKDIELCIKRETAEKIRKVANKLGYRRSEAALQMQSGRSKNIIQFLPEGMGDFFAVAAMKTSNAAIEQGYSVKELFHRDNDDEFEELVNKTLGQWPVAYMTWSSDSKFDILRRIATKHDIPVITLDFAEDLATASVMTDERCGVHQAVDYLYSTGHRLIGHATDTLKAKFALDRYELFRRVLDEQGLVFKEEYCFHEESKDNPKYLIDYVERLTQMNDRPTAIMCGSDYIAFRMMMICPNFGLKIPDDISIVGYGGLPISDQCVPRLTTIAQPFDNYGSVAMDILLKILSDKRYSKQCLLPTELKVGGSTRSLSPVSDVK